MYTSSLFLGWRNTWLLLSYLLCAVAYRRQLIDLNQSGASIKDKEKSGNPSEVWSSAIDSGQKGRCVLADHWKEWPPQHTGLSGAPKACLRASRASPADEGCISLTAGPTVSCACVCVCVCTMQTQTHKLGLQEPVTVSMLLFYICPKAGLPAMVCRRVEQQTVWQ